MHRRGCLLGTQGHHLNSPHLYNLTKLGFFTTFLFFFIINSKVLWVGKLRDAADQSQAGELWCFGCQATGREKQEKQSLWRWGRRVGVVSASHLHLHLRPVYPGAGSLLRLLALWSLREDTRQCSPPKPPPRQAGDGCIPGRARAGLSRSNLKRRRRKKINK